MFKTGSCEILPCGSWILQLDHTPLTRRSQHPVEEYDEIHIALAHVITHLILEPVKKKATEITI